jgi:serine/threonine protein kinase
MEASAQVSPNGATPGEAVEIRDEFPTGTVVADRFEVERKLGFGGQGTVLLVKHRWLGRRLALKIARDDSERVNRLLMREAQTVSRFSHPAIMDIVDAGYLSDGRVYVASSWRDTASLELLAQQREGGSEDRRFTVVEALTVADQLLKGLALLHADGLLHLDIKPSNVLVPFVDGLARFEDCYLIDFGVAATLRLSHDGETWHARGGRLAGTALFMAPEQLAGLPRTPASDMYGLAATLFWLVTGRAPLAKGGVQSFHFDADGLDVSISLVPDRLLHDFQPLEDRSLPVPFADLLFRWLRSSPEERPQTAGAAHAEVETVLRQL